MHNLLRNRMIGLQVGPTWIRRYPKARIEALIIELERNGRFLCSDDFSSVRFLPRV